MGPHTASAAFEGLLTAVELRQIGLVVLELQLLVVRKSWVDKLGYIYRRLLVLENSTNLMNFDWPTAFINLVLILTKISAKMNCNWV